MHIQIPALGLLIWFGSWLSHVALALPSSIIATTDNGQSPVTDQRFTITIKAGTRQLNDIDTYSALLDGLGDLALKDFEEQVFTQNYAEGGTYIQVLPYPLGTSLHNKYLVEGLFQIVAFFTKQPFATDTTFYLRFDNEVIALVVFAKVSEGAPPPAALNATVSTAESDARNGTPITLSSLDDPSASSMLEMTSGMTNLTSAATTTTTIEPLSSDNNDLSDIKFTLGFLARSVTYQDFFHILAGTIALSARKSKDEVIVENTPFELNRVPLRFLVQPTPRTAEPNLKNEYVIRGAHRMAVESVSRNRYVTMFADVRWERAGQVVQLGKFLMFPRRLGGEVGEGEGSGVSAS